MSLVCPICKSPAQELPHTGHATGFECPTHGKFKVADSIVADLLVASPRPPLSGTLTIREVLEVALGHLGARGSPSTLIGSA